MQNTCPNPSCGAMYNLAAAHVGRSFACKKCGSTLLVTAAGLELAGAPASVQVEPIGPTPGGEDPSMRRPPRFSAGAGAAFGEFWAKVKADLPTWLLGIGIFFVVVCLFFPLLDQAKVLRRQVKVDAGERKLRQQVTDLRK